MAGGGCPRARLGVRYFAMPSYHTDVAPFVTDRWPSWRQSTAATLVFGALPLCGLMAELAFGILSSVLPLFPDWGHTLALLLAVVANVALHAGAMRSPERLLLRTAAIGFVLGMCGLYALAEAPMLPAMVLLSIGGIGILAASPYIAGIGMLRMLRDLSACWQASGRAHWQMPAIVLLTAALPFLPAIVSMRRHAEAPASLAKLAAAMEREHEATGAAASEAAADQVRRGDVKLQRQLCATQRDDDEAPFHWLTPAQPGPFGHLADGRPFWFARRIGSLTRIDLTRARMAFHRAHGEAWDDASSAPPSPWDAASNLAWQSSRVAVHPEIDAALARVDWEVEVAAIASRNLEARFDLHLPPGAVASSLSLWIDGAERPAAFASAGRVEAAYQEVVRKARDPALLREVAPGRLQLLLFPVSHDRPAMRARLGFTVPLRHRGSHAWLHLPEIVSHNCRHGRAPTHSLHVDGAAPGEVDDAALRQPIRVAMGANLAHARDAAGELVQELVARQPQPTVAEWVLVLEASASVGKALSNPDVLLTAFPATAHGVLFVAHGDGHERIEGTFGDAALRERLRAMPFSGGVDARPALAAAIAVAQQRGNGRVLWLHGAMATEHRHPWPTVPTGIELLPFALHPGRHVLHESPLLRPHLAPIARFGHEPEALVDSLTEFVQFGASEDGDIGDRERRFSRPTGVPGAATAVSDQLARLWAARQSRAEAKRGSAKAATELAARYRVVTAGAGAVVLERREQYVAAGLDPGAEIGREPEGPAGSGPVPEPSTLLLTATGLLVLLWVRRRRAA